MKKVVVETGQLASCAGSPAPLPEGRHDAVDRPRCRFAPRLPAPAEHDEIEQDNAAATKEIVNHGIPRQ